MIMTKAVVWDQGLTELLGERLTQLLIQFYHQSYEYYLLTGHDLIENPEKQDMIIQRATDEDVIQSLIVENKGVQARLEQNIADTILSLERLASQLKTLLREFPAMRRIREEALIAARESCSDVLNINRGKITLRHFTLTELSRRGLYFSTDTDKKAPTAKDNNFTGL